MSPPSTIPTLYKVCAAHASPAVLCDQGRGQRPARCLPPGLLRNLRGNPDAGPDLRDRLGSTQTQGKAIVWELGGLLLGHDDETTTNIIWNKSQDSIRRKPGLVVGLTRVLPLSSFQVAPWRRSPGACPRSVPADHHQAEDGHHDHRGGPFLN